VRVRPAGGTAADRRRAVPGVALGGSSPVRRRVLRRSCQPRSGEIPAGALRPPPAEYATRYFAPPTRAASRGITCPHDLRRAPRALMIVKKILTRVRGSRLSDSD